MREGSLGSEDSPERVSLNLEKLSDPWSRSFSSSAVRRSWYWSSCAFDRVESVYSIHQPHSDSPAYGRLTKVFFWIESTSPLEKRTG